jgi:hypothetical protein
LSGNRGAFHDPLPSLDIGIIFAYLSQLPMRSTVLALKDVWNRKDILAEVDVLWWWCSVAGNGQRIILNTRGCVEIELDSDSTSEYENEQVRARVY